MAKNKFNSDDLDAFLAAIPLEQRRKLIDGPTNPVEMLFGQQRAFVEDKSKYKVAVCSRRAGKTIGAAVDLLMSALSHDSSTNLYITRSRKNAKRILWTTLKEFNKDNRLGGVVNENDLHMQFQNGSSIYLAGATDRDAIEDFRGLAMAKAIIDEAQSMPSYIEDLVDAVLAPALMDFDGSLVLIGTPAPVPVGYFYDASHNTNGKSGWSAHHWTAFDNPFLEKKSGKTARQLMDAELRRRGVREEDPTTQREWFGKWVKDTNNLVFHVDANRNTYTTLPRRDGWQHVIGVDVGFEDADALVVLAFHDQEPGAYEVDEWVGNKTTISELAARVHGMITRYRPISIVMDTGGLGRKIAEELRHRPPAIPIRAAEKTRKIEFIELLNDALRSRQLWLRPDSQFIHDARLIEWDRDRCTPDRMVISRKVHSDCADALLYCYRESLHWLHEQPQRAPVLSQDEARAAYLNAERDKLWNGAVTMQQQEREQMDFDETPFGVGGD